MRELADPVEIPLVMLMICIEFEGRLRNIKRSIHLAWRKSPNRHNSPRIVAILLEMGELRCVVIVIKIS